MAYKSILTLWDGKDSSKPAMDRAIQFTKESGGHLHVICPAFSTIKAALGFPYSEIPMAVSENEREKLTEKVIQLKAEAEKLVNAEDIYSSVEAAVLNRDELPDLMDHAARFSDLVILPQPYGSERTETDEKITESALMANHCPILIVPTDEIDTTGSNVVIAWDGGRQALRAAKMAMPLLEKADKVDVVIVAKDPDKILPEQVSSDIATFLARHQINVEIKVVPKSGEAISDLIRDQAREIGANLIVMGGYGHSPVREFLFGGPTRKMLEDSRIPIFMAH